ncbi:MAG: 30S ribosomal protein S1, partial [Terracidiphilus sp.]
AKSASVASAAQSVASPESGKADLSQLSSMLKDRWKGNTPAPQAAPEPLSEGQIRNFKITKIIADTKKIEVELA